MGLKKKEWRWWALHAAYRAGVLDGRMQEAYDRDSKEPVKETWFEEGRRKGYLWINEV